MGVANQSINRTVKKLCFLWSGYFKRYVLEMDYHESNSI